MTVLTHWYQYQKNCRNVFSTFVVLSSYKLFITIKVESIAEILFDCKLIQRRKNYNTIT